MAGELAAQVKSTSLLIAAVLLLCVPAATYEQQMRKPKYKIHHIKNDFPVHDLNNKTWRSADDIKIGTYWNGTAAPAGRRFDVLMLWSTTALYVRFDAEQSEPLVVSEKPQLVNKTMRLWDRDVCELFLAPDAKNPRRYAEFEIAPTGEWLDLVVDWAKSEPRDWEYISGMESSALVESGKVTMAMKIPWKAFDRKPKAGDVWLGNLFRQVGSGEARGYLAWSPTMTSEPQFHVPERFGEFVFEK